MKSKTLQKIDRIRCQNANASQDRYYLGMSEIGTECKRQLFYSFRKAKKRVLDQKSVKAIEDGHLQESLMANQLRILPLIELHTEENGDQIGFSDIDGHFCGHVDGMIKGIEQDILKWFVWEHKSVNEKKFSQLVKICEEKGEKLSLKEWDYVYYCQAIMYMHYSGVGLHYLTVTTPGGRDDFDCITEYDSRIATILIEKANDIISSTLPPARLSDKREFYKCKWCNYQEICHDGVFPDVNCKTCKHIAHKENGSFYCVIKKKAIKKEKINVACDSHVYLSGLIDAQEVNYNDDCTIFLKNGIYFSNCAKNGFPPILENKDIQIFTSKELFKNIKSVQNIQEKALKLQKKFKGEIIR